jgi:hypothetical protein
MISATNAVATQRPFSVPKASFSDLFGLTQSEATKLFDPAFTACLGKAHEDFNAAASGNDPVHSKLEAMVADGGTTNWRGECYDLTIVLHAETFRTGNVCYIGTVFGPSLRIRARAEWHAAITRTKLFRPQRESCR